MATTFHPQTTHLTSTGQAPIHAFLTSQSQNSLSRLYARPSACLAVFRLLDAVARQIVMSLLWLDTKSGVDLDAWVQPNPEARQHYTSAVGSLARLYIAREANGKIGLIQAYRDGLRRAITGGGEHRSFGVPCQPDRSRKDTMSVQQLDEYALERWETILHYMVSSGTASAPSQAPSKNVMDLLTRSGLMENRAGQLKISSKGFQFLLEDSHTQLWELLLQYLQMAEANQTDVVEVVGLLFTMGSMELGQEYTTDNLSSTQSQMVEDLRDYGLVWMNKPKAKRFYPTRLATSLTSSSATAFSRSQQDQATGEGFIILETNYRLYAYTDNPLQIAVLNLFITLQARFSNLVVGRLTRESVKAALGNGITADQIISYLTAHAHPMMRKYTPILPVTVQDQVRLWEMEKNRLQVSSGFMYNGFSSLGDYDFVLAYAKQLDVVVWESREKRAFFITEDGHASVRGFVNRRREAAKGDA